jgi:hypothetical protein
MRSYTDLVLFRLQRTVRFLSRDVKSQPNYNSRKRERKGSTGKAYSSVPGRVELVHSDVCATKTRHRPRVSFSRSSRFILRDYVWACMNRLTSVFTSDRVTLALRVHRDRVARSESTLDARDLLLKDPVEEPHFKVAVPCASRRHVHRFLSTAHDDLLEHRRRSIVSVET